MNKINLGISGCMGRMGQQLIRSSKKNKGFKLVTLTENILVNKKFSFDKNFKGDFNLNDNLVSKTMNRELIYTGCQILNRSLFHDYKIENFSITCLWDELIKKNELFGFESKNDFYHLTDHQTFKKLQDL